MLISLSIYTISVEDGFHAKVVVRVVTEKVKEIGMFDRDDAEESYKYE